MTYVLDFSGLWSELLNCFLLVLLSLVLLLSILLPGSLGAFLLCLLTDWGISYETLSHPFALVFNFYYTAGPAFPEVAEGWQALQELLAMVGEPLYHILDSLRPDSV